MAILNGQTAFIVGAGSAIGATVSLMGRSMSRLEAVRERILSTVIDAEIVVHEADTKGRTP